MSPERLLAGLGSGPVNFQRHCELHGPLRMSGGALGAALVSVGLRGRGGGGFPLARKLTMAARGRGRPIIIANGCEGEPMSAKDRVLIRSVPHLIVDGALTVSDAIGADRILLAVDEQDLPGADSLTQALTERGDLRGDRRRIEVATVPTGYVTGQETALVNWFTNRRAAPTVAVARVTERGVDGRPTLVSNVETLAHVGLIARHGVRWFEEQGTPEEPGTTLATLSGAVSSPGVYEIEYGRSLSTLLHRAGGLSEPARGVLIGGYAGTWVRPDEIRALTLDAGTLMRAGARLGAGVVVVLPASACPVAETARVADWMASQSARQCGPCVHGLAAIADALNDVADGRDGRRALADIARSAAQIPGRGACAHPDGVVGMVSSALRVFRPAFLDHAEHGPCRACDGPAVLRTAALATSGSRL